ncbi:hypothetical protein D3C87_1977600 [compost metagenome]
MDQEILLHQVVRIKHHDAVIGAWKLPQLLEHPLDGISLAAQVGVEPLESINAVAS